MPSQNSFRVSSFNCRSIKSSVTEVCELCGESDIVFLQEHWLLPFELDMLNSLHSDFYSSSKSAVDISRSVLVGRPYGGTAVLYRKELATCIKVVETCDPRLCAIKFDSNVGPILFVCVYMPCDQGDSDCFENFLDICGKINSLYIEIDVVHCMVAGDFNCQPGSRFYDLLKQLAEDHNLQLSDIKRLNNVFTYCRDGGLCTSWIDHCLCSIGLDQLISSIEVLFQYVSSDHKPIMTIFSGLCGNINAAVDNSVESNEVYFDWSKADAHCLQMYKTMLNDHLSHVDIPVDVLTDADGHCATRGVKHRHVTIQKFYDSVMSCIMNACRLTIPQYTPKSHCYTVPGWNDYVDEKHNEARRAYLDWMALGKPRQGFGFSVMNKTRAAFKLALRYCRQHEDMLRADSYARNLSDKEFKLFWSSIHKSSNAKSAQYANVVGGCIGDVNIAEMWRNHFEHLYNSVKDDGSRNKFYERLHHSSHVNNNVAITVYDVFDAISKQKLGKAVGPDGIAMEALVHGGAKLVIHICFLFNMFIKCGFLPDMFMSSAIVPLVKCKSGDLADVNNYRAIAISSAISKIFEHIIASHLYTVADCDSSQFGFKTGHSTSLCTSVFKRVVEHYINRGSHVFVCFIDFSKAFDKVNYWKLLNKLLDDNVDSNITRILAFWFCKQVASVRWHSAVSQPFDIGNGTRQGGVLSPYLFSRYIRELLMELELTQLGCNVGGMLINTLAYADDIVLLAPSWRALQKLIDVLFVHSTKIDMLCNTQKSVCMVFNPRDRNKLVSTSYPNFTLGSSLLQFASAFKYLGHMITNDLSDDTDIEREVRNMFVRTNILARRFSRCSMYVKVALFRAYCISLYDAALWKRYKQGSMHKLSSCYNKCVKIFFNYRRRDSMTQILFNLSLPCFKTIVVNSSVVFARCYAKCRNSIIQHLYSLGY